MAKAMDPCDASFWTGTSEARQSVQEACAKTNAARAENGLTPLRLDEKLTLLAQAFAQDMRTRGYFSHIDPEGLSPFDRMKNAGISFHAAGENIYRGSTGADDAVAAWLNSPPHRANILNSSYGKIGIGAIDGYWVQDFTN